MNIKKLNKIAQYIFEEMAERYQYSQNKDNMVCDTTLIGDMDIQ